MKCTDAIGFNHYCKECQSIGKVTGCLPAPSFGDAVIVLRNFRGPHSTTGMKLKAGSDMVMQKNLFGFMIPLLISLIPDRSRTHGWALVPLNSGKAKVIPL